MKRCVFLYLLVGCLIALCAFPAAAAEATEAAVSREPGWCAEKIRWSFEDGTLTLSGEGEMDDYPDGAPWAEFRDEITTLCVGDGITYIGAHAFKDCDKLTEIEFGGDVYEIGQEAFSSCDALTAVYLPASFKIFGEGSFQSCKNLKEFHCEGKFPSFRQNCLWDTFATIYYPVDRPWNLDNIAELESAFKGRIAFISSDGTDHYVPEEPTEEETVPDTTAAATEPETEPMTEPMTEPVTEPVTQPFTEPEQTQTEPPATEPDAGETDAPQERDGAGVLLIFLGLVIIVAVLTIVLILALILKGKKGRFSA